MSPWNLPSGVVDYLQAGLQLEYDPARCEPGVVKLKSLKELELGDVWVYPVLPGDPHAGEEGFYRIPAISLTGFCDAYDPEFILLWLPREQLFGTWDCDHATLSVFPGAKWSDIVARPAEFLNAQWDADSSVARPTEPWHLHQFSLGEPF